MHTKVIRKWLKSNLIAFCGFIGKDFGPKILFLHDVHLKHKFCAQSMQIQDMQERMSMAKMRGFHFVAECPQEDGEVMLCFDDGYRGIYDCRDYFLGSNVRPTIFVAIDLIGRKDYLCWQEILELQRLGFRFESHTWSHQRLTDIPKNKLQHELLDSRKCLEDHLQKRIAGLCFPLGRFNSRICDCAIDSGYEELYSSIPGNSDRRILPNLICRNLIQEMSKRAFVGSLYGGANFFWKHYYDQHCISL